MRCSCGKEFDIDEAASTFNSHYDEEFDYYLNGWENWCADCAISNTELDKQEGVDDGNIPVGCRICGGNYPHCTYSCPMFDN